jgi:hypothetical protein
MDIFGVVIFLPNPVLLLLQIKPLFSSAFALDWEERLNLERNGLSCIMGWIGSLLCLYSEAFFLYNLAVGPLPTHSVFK